MVAPFPLAKLLTLVMRQAAKPVAKGIKSLARKNTTFRKYVCVLPAQSESLSVCIVTSYSEQQMILTRQIVPSLVFLLLISLGFVTISYRILIDLLGV